MTPGPTSLDTAADTAAGVLAFARDRRAAADAAEADLLRARLRLGGPAPGGVDR